MPSTTSLSQLAAHRPQVCLALKSLTCVVGIVSLVLTCISFSSARPILANAFTLCLIVLSILDIVFRMLCGVNANEESPSATSRHKCTKLM